MYLKKILLENVWPIDKIDFELPFDSEWNPKPLILVWENWTWKSNLLSYIFDSIYEFHKQLFSNISENNAYFRFSWWNNIKEWKEYLLSYLLFENNTEKLEYIDKNWNITIEDVKNKTNSIFDKMLNIWNFSINNFKSTTKIDKSWNIENDFKANSYCYFPADRTEIPNWLNVNSLKEESFYMKNFFSWTLEKDLILDTTLSNNKKWLLDVVLDYYHDYDISKNLWVYIKDILGNIFSDDSLRLWIWSRNNFSRISIVRDLQDWNSEMFLPSINCLSQWQAVLFNLFISIIKSSDSNPKTLNEIKGIVIIDEVDLHLHSNLQKEILPKLIKLFPKVQFIITTHSPLFVLWMEETFWVDWIQIREMPNWDTITAERFKEFETAFKYFSETKTFEEKLENNVKNSEKNCILFVEWITDVKHINIAKNKLGISMDFDIFDCWCANKLKQFLVWAPKDYFGDKKIVWIFDYDYEWIKSIKWLSTNFNIITDNLYQSKSNSNVYAITLPTNDENFKKYEYCPIEFLYSKEKLLNENFIIKRKLSDINGTDFIRSNEDLTLNKNDLDGKDDLWFYKIDETNISKNNFAEKVNNYEVWDFENFKPLFEIIETIIN